MKTVGDIRNEERIIRAMESICESLDGILIALKGIEAVLDRGISVRT